MPKYDFIFSLGAACSCTQMLRKAQLQFASYPLDWLFGLDLAGRIDIVASRFERFLEETDLTYTYSERSISCDAYHNAFNDLTFNHDFESGKELKETYPAVKEKYDRRIKRLLDRIDQAKSVLGVYIETPNSGISKYTKQDLENIHAKLKNAFPDKRFALYFAGRKLGARSNRDTPRMWKRFGLGRNGIQLQKARYTGLRAGFSRFAENIEKLQAESASVASVKAIASAFVYPRDPNQIHTQKTKTKIPVLKGTRMNFTNNTFLNGMFRLCPRP